MLATFPTRGRQWYGGKNGTLIFYLFPTSSGRRCPEGAEVGSRSEMKRNVRQSILSYRHPERSRGIFFGYGFLLSCVNLSA